MATDMPPGGWDGAWNVEPDNCDEELSAIHQRYRYEVIDLGPPPDNRCLICDAFNHFNFPDERPEVFEGLEYHAPAWNFAGTLHQHSVHPVYTNDDVERDLSLLRAELARLAAARPGLRPSLQFLASKLDDPGFVDWGPPYARLSVTAMARMCEVARGLLEIRRFITYAPRETDAGDVNLDERDLEDAALDAFLAEIDPDGVLDDADLSEIFAEVDTDGVPAPLDSGESEGDTSGLPHR